MEFHDLYFHTELLASHQPAVVHCASAGEREAVLVAVPCYQPAESSLPQRLFHSDLHSYSYSPTLERASYSRSVTRNSRSVCLSVCLLQHHHDHLVLDRRSHQLPASVSLEEWTADANWDVGNGKICFSPRFHASLLHSLLWLWLINRLTFPTNDKFQHITCQNLRVLVHRFVSGAFYVLLQHHWSITIGQFFLFYSAQQTLWIIIVYYIVSKCTRK